MDNTIMIMKSWQYLKRLMPLVVGTIAASILVYAQMHTARAEVSTAVGNDVSGSELRSLTIESWDYDRSGGGYGWEVVTDKDNALKKNNPYKPLDFTDQAEREAKLIPGTPADVKDNINFKDARVQGVRFAFTFPGYNVVTIRPPWVDHYKIERPRPYLFDIASAAGQQNTTCYKDATLSQTRKTTRPVMVDCIRGIDMPGNVKAVSVWVMGRGNEYDLEGWFEDWKGDTHILKFGSVDFIGWRPLSVKIPIKIPQDVDSFPQIKTLAFRQFKLRSRPKTSLEPVYIFFDELRILTDVFEVNFDGAQLDFDENDCSRKNRLLKLIRTNSRFPERWPDLVDCKASPGPAKAGDFKKAGTP